MPFLLLFFGISLVEIYLFAFMGEQIGAFKTLLLCFITAIIGGSLVKWQGLNTLMKAQTNFKGGKLPVNEVFDGFCIVIAGATLITPGFLTDFIGFLLLLPLFRLILKEFMLKKTNFEFHSTENTHHNRNTSLDGVIEGEYEEVDNNSDKLK